MSKRKAFEDYLNDANARLKAGAIALRIEHRGDKLDLRGMLPPKPGSDGGDKTQRISLGLGANLENLKVAEAQARHVSGLLSLQQFDWHDFLKIPSPATVTSPTLEDVVERLAQDYLMLGGNPETWRREYLGQYKKLADMAGWDRPIEGDLLQEFLEGIDPSSRSRVRAAIAVGKLAAAAGIDGKFAKGSYRSDSPINPRDIPTDEEIAQWFHKIEHPLWKNGFALQAVYGLRSYEIFKLDLSEFPLVFCHRGKTDADRFIYPLYPEWADQWLRPPIALPTATGKNSTIGRYPSNFFRRAGIPFKPYDLRHAWARRAREVGWATGDAATQMGHSESVHRKIYQHWINLDSYKKTFDLLINNPNRPKPPI